MNQNEHAWLKLVEECAEVQQRVLKLLQFGPDEREPGQGLTNKERVRLEIADVSATTYRLMINDLFEPMDGDELDEHILSKDDKVSRYMLYSMERGYVLPMPELIEAVDTVIAIAEGSTTANSLPNIAKILRAVRSLQI